MTILNRCARYYLAILLLSIPLWTGSAMAQEASPYPSMTGKTVLITGSTDGLGREVALRLGRLGAHVLVHGRNAARGGEVLAAIKADGGSAAFYQADLASLENVRGLAAAVMRDHPRLDLLINNAGLGSGLAGGQRQVSEDGYEMIFHVNYLSHYLLTELLLPALKAGAPSRVVNVASGAQRAVDFDDVMMEQAFDSRAAYAQSKLAQILHAFYLSPRLATDGITINALHPASLMNTTMVAQMQREPRSTVDEGATALMQLAVAPELEGRTGLYFRGLVEDRADAQAYDAAALEKLDELTRRLVGLPPR